MATSYHDSPLARFLKRYQSRSLILHGGLPPNWLGELLKQPGGGGYFRIDVRTFGSGHPPPVEWVISKYILPLELPIPLLIQVDSAQLYLRHLLRRDKPVHPSEILWFLEEIGQRHHACLRHIGGRLEASVGIPLTDNEPLAMFDYL